MRQGQVAEACRLAQKLVTRGLSVDEYARLNRMCDDLELDRTRLVDDALDLFEARS